MSISSSHKNAKRIGQYELVRQVDRGFLGPLWALRFDLDGSSLLALGRLVELDPGIDSALRERLNEAAWEDMELQGKGLLHCADVVFEGNSQLLVCDYAEGQPLSALTRLRWTFPVGVALRIGLDLLEALVELVASNQNMGIENGHGCISADSVLVATDGKTHLLHPLVSAAASAHQHFQNRPEKASYLAPEQWLQQECDLRSDLYGVGCVLWELLAQRRLHVVGPDGIRRNVTSGKLPSLKAPRGNPDLPEALTAAVTRALSRQRESRFDSAQGMRAALQASAAPIASHAEVAQFVEALASEQLKNQRAATENSTVADLGELLKRERTFLDRPKAAAASAPESSAPSAAAPEVASEPQRAALPQPEVQEPRPASEPTHPKPQATQQAAKQTRPAAAAKANATLLGIAPMAAAPTAKPATESASSSSSSARALSAAQRTSSASVRAQAVRKSTAATANTTASATVRPRVNLGPKTAPPVVTVAATAPRPVLDTMVDHSLDEPTVVWDRKSEPLSVAGLYADAGVNPHYHERDTPLDTATLAAPPASDLMDAPAPHPTTAQLAAERAAQVLAAHAGPVQTSPAQASAIPAPASTSTAALGASQALNPPVTRTAALPHSHLNTTLQGIAPPLFGLASDTPAQAVVETAALAEPAPTTSPSDAPVSDITERAVVTPTDSLPAQDWSVPSKTRQPWPPVTWFFAGCSVSLLLVLLVQQFSGNPAAPAAPPAAPAVAAEQQAQVPPRPALVNPEKSAPAPSEAARTTSAGDAVSGATASAVGNSAASVSATTSAALAPNGTVPATGNDPAATSTLGTSAATIPPAVSVTPQAPRARQRKSSSTKDTTRKGNAATGNKKFVPRDL